jgi:hypothetical protein
MVVAEKVLKLLDIIFVTFKVTTRDLYVIPCANIKELLAIACMITVVSITARLLNMPVFLDYRGCIVGAVILGIVCIFTKSKQ